MQRNPCALIIPQGSMKTNIPWTFNVQTTLWCYTYHSFIQKVANHDEYRPGKIARRILVIALGIRQDFVRPTSARDEL